MTPTPKLRLVERKDFTEDPANPAILRVLQQWWALDPRNGYAISNGFNGEWRDVPLEEEE